MVDVPRASNMVTASWLEEDDDALGRLTFHARHSDLVVMGRMRRPNGLPSDLLELLLIHCGRPMLIACATPPRDITGTIMVCWRDTADAARATSSAMPFLTKATRVIFAAVSGSGRELEAAVNDAASQFRWNGIASEAQVVSANGRATAEVLALLARDCGADMLVMGAYDTRGRASCCLAAAPKRCCAPPLGDMAALLKETGSSGCRSWRMERSSALSAGQTCSRRWPPCQRQPARLRAPATRRSVRRYSRA